MLCLFIEGKSNKVISCDFGIVELMVKIYFEILYWWLDVILCI